MNHGVNSIETNGFRIGEFNQTSGAKAAGTVITTRAIPGGSRAVFYNSDVTQNQFRESWGLGPEIVLIPVDNWENLNNNGIITRPGIVVAIWADTAMFNMAGVDGATSVTTELPDTRAPASVRGNSLYLNDPEEADTTAGYSFSALGVAQSNNNAAIPVESVEPTVIIVGVQADGNVGTPGF